MITGSIGLLAIILVIALGVPIGFALSIVSFIGLIYVGSFGIAVSITRNIVLNYMSTYTWSVIPMFILMGHFGYYSGLLKDIFEVAQKWFGHLPAGLAISVEMANAVFAAASGSSQAACIVIGKSAIPALQEAGYGDRISTGVVAAGGSIAALIPPSLTMCIYGLLVDESIAKLLIAGILPGIITALIYIIFIYFRCRRLPTTKIKYSWKEKLYSIRYLWIVVVLIIAIMGGIYTGWTFIASNFLR